MIFSKILKKKNALHQKQMILLTIGVNGVEATIQEINQRTTIQNISKTSNNVRSWNVSQDPNRWEETSGHEEKAPLEQMDPKK